MVAGQVVVPQISLQTVSPIRVASGAVSINLQWTIVTPVDSRSLLSLASGANTITVPAGATFLVISPPTTNTTITLTLKGVTGDTGVQIAKATPTVLSLGTVSTFCLTASGILAGVEFIFL